MSTTTARNHFLADHQRLPGDRSSDGPGHKHGEALRFDPPAVRNSAATPASCGSGAGSIVQAERSQETLTRRKLVRGVLSLTSAAGAVAAAAWASSRGLFGGSEAPEEPVSPAQPAELTPGSGPPSSPSRSRPPRLTLAVPNSIPYGLYSGRVKSAALSVLPAVQNEAQGRFELELVDVPQTWPGNGHGFPSQIEAIAPLVAAGTPPDLLAFAGWPNYGGVLSEFASAVKAG